MDEVFFKSALPAQGALVLDDTSLALPAEPTQRSSTELGSDKRSSRVYQQVQLTLARKARKSMSNGNISYGHREAYGSRSPISTDNHAKCHNSVRLCVCVQFSLHLIILMCSHIVLMCVRSILSHVVFFFFCLFFFFLNLWTTSSHRKSENKPEEMTLEKAVNLLTQDNEDTLIFATTHIQNLCLNSTDAKKMVFDLHGIEKLVQLLCSDSEEVQCVAAGALRNVVCQSGKNKMEVKKNDGLAVILGTLKSSHDVETRRQLTGLLWNLSSHDLLKEGLIKEGLPILTQSVLVPCSGLSEGENPKDELLADADVFHFTTGCLRNLSSAGPDGRKAMRECKNLIDSLVYYIRGTIADHKTDDKSTENCVCILHNLSYQFEAEIPKKYTQDRSQSQQNLAPKPKTVGCFAHRTHYPVPSQVLERQSSLLEDKANPCGIEWLWSPITLRMYLSLIACSVRQYTQEAAIGALQNITAGNGAMSEAIAFTLVQQEKNLQHIKYILQEGEGDVKRTALSLIKNLSRYNELQPEIVNQVLPDVVGMLPNDDTGTDLPAEVTASLCHILINLSQANSQNVKAIVKERALLKIINISNKDNGCGPSRAGQAACILLHTIWKHTDLHKDFKKLGYRKTDFINARTNKAVKSR
uniref:Plakophilin 2 n=1 Tax=Mastacembelus armatus TaxID=205130 RepID=A0A3Q3LZJ9_9TELE